MPIPIRPICLKRASSAFLLLVASSFCLATTSSDEIERLLDTSVRKQLVSQLSQQPGIKVDVAIGSLDPRLQLAPCQRVEPFLPPSVVLWGKTVMGVRCVAGATWSVTVPVQVTVTGPALVAATNLNAGSTPSDQDFKLATVELSKEPLHMLNHSLQLQGRVLTRSLVAGQVLRADHLRLVPTINPGDIVKVKLIGDGFTLTYDAIAMSAAAPGQLIRVRSENGKILSGSLKDRSIELQL